MAYKVTRSQGNQSQGFIVGETTAKHKRTRTFNFDNGKVDPMHFQDMLCCICLHLRGLNLVSLATKDI